MESCLQVSVLIQSFEISHILVEFRKQLSLDAKIGVTEISTWRLCVHFFVDSVSNLSCQLHFERIFFILGNIRVLHDLFGLEEISLRQIVEFQVDSFVEVLFEREQFLDIFVQLLEHLLLGIYRRIFITLLDLPVLRFRPSADIEISHELFCS